MAGLSKTAYAAGDGPDEVIDRRPTELRRQRLGRTGFGLILGRWRRNHRPLLRLSWGLAGEGQRLGTETAERQSH